MKLWRPKDPKALAVIRLTLWSGILAWVVFTVALGILYARQFALLTEKLFAENGWNYFIGHWIGPVWIIFTVLLLAWAVIRFANRRLRK